MRPPASRSSGSVPAGRHRHVSVEEERVDNMRLHVLWDFGVIVLRFVLDPTTATTATSGPHPINVLESVLLQFRPSVCHVAFLAPMRAAGICAGDTTAPALACGCTLQREVTQLSPTSSRTLVGLTNHVVVRLK